MVNGRLRTVARAALACAVALTLGACAVYEPAPAYPAYGYYAPGYYAAPASSFSFGYSSGGHDGYHHHHHW